MYGGGTIQDGFIGLNGNIYKCNDEGLNDLLGYAVQAFVIENDKNDYNEIICASIDTRKSKEITALSKDIEEIGENYAKILENNRTKTIKIRDGFDMIYNGIGVKNHDNVKPEYGEVKFIDNTGDGVYDILFVKDYKVICVKSFSNDGKLLQIVGDDDSVFSANISEPENIVKVYLNDEPQSTSKTDVITSGSVIWLADSGVGDIRLIEIRKFSNSENGVVSAVSDDSIILDGKTYGMCPLVDNSKAKKCVGNTASVYFDSYGNVICVKKENSGKAYGYLYKGVYIEEDEEYEVEILNTDNEWHKYRLCKNVRCNGDKLKAEEMYNNLLILNTEGINVVKKQPVRFETDAAGKIKRLDIAQYSNSPNGTIDIDYDDYLRKNDYFRKSRGYAKRTYNHDASVKGLFISNTYDTWCECFFTKDLKVLVHPDTQELQKEEIKFETRSYFTVTGQYFCEIYDIDEENSTPLVEVLGESKPKVTHRAKYIAVDRIGLALDEDDSPVKFLYGYENGVYTEYEAAEDDSFTFKGEELKRGDLVRVALNTLGKVDSIEEYSTNLLRFRVDSDPTKYFTDYSSVGHNVNAFGYQYNQTVVGRVNRIFGNYVRVAVKNGEYIHAMLESTSIMVYDSSVKNRPWRKGTKADIALNDVIFLQMVSGRVEDVFVYKL